MAVPYSNTKLRVPRGFQNILESLAREVLRAQPDDVYAFGAVYFEGLMKGKSDGGVDPAAHGAATEDRFYNNKAFQKPDVDPSNPQQQDAALKIQTKYRQHHAKAYVKTKREEVAATKIQAGFRGFQDRKSVQTLKDNTDGSAPAAGEDEEEEVDIDLADPEVQAAATKIQAGYKGFRARKDVQHMKEDKTDEKKAEEEEVDIDLDDPEVAAAATKIQAGFKGMQARKEVKSMKDGKDGEEAAPAKTQEEEEVDIDLDDPEVAAAASKIQAGFKGMQARKEVKSMKEAKAEKAADPDAQGEVAKDGEAEKVEDGEKKEEEGEKKEDEGEKKEDGEQKEEEGEKKEEEGEKKEEEGEKKEEEGEKKEEEGEKKEGERPKMLRKLTTRMTINEETGNKMWDVLEAFPSFSGRAKAKRVEGGYMMSGRIINRAKKWVGKARTAVKDKESAYDFVYHFNSEDLNDVFFDADEDDEGTDTDGGAQEEEEGTGFGAGLQEGLQEFTQTMTDSFMPMIQVFYSKELLYPTVKAGAVAYPPFLDSHQDLPADQLQKYTRQAAIFQEVATLFEEETPEEGEQTKNERNQKVMRLMEENQRLGDAPQEVQLAQMEHQPDPETAFSAMAGGLGGMFESMTNMLGGDSDSDSGDSDAGCTIL